MLRYPLTLRIPRALLASLLLRLVAPTPTLAQEAPPAGSPEAAAPYSLVQCIRLAQERNLTAQRSDLTTESSRASLRLAKATLYPTVNASGTGNYSSGRTVDPTTNQYINQAVGNVNATLSGTVTVFNGGQLRNTVRQSRKNVEAAQLDADASRRNLALSVTQAYVAVLKAREQLVTARRQQAETEEQLARTRKQLAAGSVPESNVLQVRAQLGTDRLSVATAENTVANDLLTLRQLMEEPADEPFDISTPTLPDPSAAPSVSTPDLYAAALAAEPQVRAYALRSESAVLGVRMARGQWLPRLTLTGSLFSSYSTARSLYTTQTTNQQQLVGYLNNDVTQPVYTTVPITTATAGSYAFSSQWRDNINPSLSTGLSIPILNNYSARRALQTANITLRTAALDERNTRNELRKSVEQAQNNLRAAERSYAAALDKRTSLERAYHNSEVKYRLGAMTPQDLLVDKNKYNTAQNDWIQAKYEYVLQLKVLDFYQNKPLAL